MENIAFLLGLTISPFVCNGIICLFKINNSNKLIQSAEGKFSGVAYTTNSGSIVITNVIFK